MISLIKDEYVNPDPIPAAIFDVVRSWVADPAVAVNDPVFNFLAGKTPQFDFESEEGHVTREEEGILVRATRYLQKNRDASAVPVLEAVAEAAIALHPSSYLAIQGPPGTGLSHYMPFSSSFSSLSFEEHRVACMSSYFFLCTFPPIFPAFSV